LLCLQAVQTLIIVHRESLTFDEGDHMFAGYMMWKTGDYGLNPEHPPLVKLLAASPLLGEKLWIPKLQNREFKQEAYLDGRDWLARNDGSSQRIVFRMRLMTELLSLALGLTVFLAGREWFGEWAGLAALTIVAFDPTVLAHSALVTTDIGVSLFLLATVYTFYRYVKQPSPRRLILAGLVGGLLLATKHSGILTAPMLLLLILWEGFSAAKGTRLRIAGRLFGAMVCMSFIAIVVLWSFYGFRYAMRPDGLPHPTVAEYVKPLGPLSAGPVLFFARFHLLPESYLIGLADVKRMAEFYSTFIFDKVYAHSVWWYFPVAMTIKTTLGFLGTIVLAAVAVVTRKLRKAREIVYVLTPACFYLLVAIVAGMNIGARHVLPFYTFMYVFAGAGAATLALMSRRWMWICGVLLVAHIVSALTVFPNDMAYANEEWGGPKNVHNLLTDANVDWAQQLNSVKKWIDKHPGEECWFSYFAYPEINPEVYGIPCHHLPTVDTFWIGGSDIIPPTVTGNVLISAGDLSGGEWSADRENPVRKFKKMQPAEVIDYAVFVYRGTFDMKDSATASRVQHAYKLLGEKKAPEALTMVKEAVEIDPQDLRSQTALGDVSAAMGMKDDARAAWTKAIAIAQTMSAEDQAATVPELQEKLKKL
jgi:hypothetical protein